MSSKFMNALTFGLLCVICTATGGARAVEALNEGTAPGEQHGASGHADKSRSSPAAAQPANEVMISLERLQSIGVKFEEAASRPLDKVIRTVGRVDFDERRLARVNVKIEGWIDRLLVNTTGEKVRKGQVLFTIYSPELLATQQEYLLAAQAVKRLGQSEFPEVASGAYSILEAAGRRLRLWDIEQSHIDDLEKSGQVLKTLPIHAPLTGTVIEKIAVAGMHVNPGDELYTIADLTTVWIIGEIYEYELPLVQVGQTATVTLSYAPDRAFQGRVGFIYPTVDEKTRTARLRFELDNSAEILKPGMYANVEYTIPLGMRLAVSKDAVLESGERKIIFIHHGGGRIEWRTAEIGVRSGNVVEILSGLVPGEHIVTSANFLIDSESQLKAAVGGMKGMKH